ncbi:hypothetical protein [Kytococcus sedentarius]|uniref:hypothetical protein n=1 Tax=Kytococcus sedentarius TaxID=1276 RepID=UPI0019513CA9|nr:hypothetical protein [Kytococcus sedentarius]QRO87632.1 hypothetical protein I6J30_01205 [Kytococcus sedentarius]
MSQSTLHSVMIAVLVGGGLLVGCSDEGTEDTKSPTSSSDASSLRGQPPSSSSSQQSSTSAEHVCWPATEGREFCGTLTSLEGKTGDGRTIDLKDVLEVKVTPDPAGDGYSMVATADGCQLWTTPLTGDAEKWIPHPDRRTDSAMGCDTPTNQPDWMVGVLDEPFSVEATDAGVIFKGEKDRITFATPVKK